MDIIARAHELLPEDIRKLLREISVLAGQAGVSIYLVGGIVRDLVMHRPNLDVDIVVDGDGTAFAKLLAKEMDGSVVIHNRFGTSVVILPGKRRLDIATARTETYAQAGALPLVSFGPIEADLGRRDFSINAMAVSLNGRELGELIDYFSGLEDIEHKRVRVLHQGSFIDDPTRIFRAVRFEQRFGFRMTAETEKLLKNAVKDGLLKTISGARIRNELMAIFDEENAADAVGRLEGFGVWGAMTPGVKADQETLRLFREIVAAEPVLEPGLRHFYKRRFTFIKALLTGSDQDTVTTFCLSLQLSRTRTKETIRAIDWAPGASLLLADKNIANSALWSELGDKTEETLVYLYAVSGGPARANIKRFMDRRTSKAIITGRDLVALGHKPSEKFAGVLADVFKAQLDGKFTTVDEGRALADKLLKAKGKN